MTSLIPSLRPLSVLEYDCSRPVNNEELNIIALFPNGVPEGHVISPVVKILYYTFTAPIATFNLFPVYQYDTSTQNLNDSFILPISTYISNLFSTVTTDIIDVDPGEGIRYVWYIYDYTLNKVVFVTQPTMFHF